MKLSAFHTLMSFFFFRSALSLIAWVLFIWLICRLLARGKQADKSVRGLHAQLEHLRLSQSEFVSDLQSDCPALSAILAQVATRVILEPGISLCIFKSPHRPLVLKLKQPVSCGGPALLVAHHCYTTKHESVPGCEMTFEVTDEGGKFLLKAVQYLPAKPEYLAAFAKLWSAELQEKGYTSAAWLSFGSLEKNHDAQTVAYTISSSSLHFSLA